MSSAFSKLALPYFGITHTKRRKTEVTFQGGLASATDAKDVSLNIPTLVLQLIVTCIYFNQTQRPLQHPLDLMM